MKKTSKAKALQKAPPVKAKKHSLKLTALQKAKAKSSSKKPATSNPGQKKTSLEKDKGLTKENLEKLGSLSLEDKQSESSSRDCKNRRGSSRSLAKGHEQS